MYELREDASSWAHSNLVSNVKIVYCQVTDSAVAMSQYLTISLLFRLRQEAPDHIHS